MSAAVAVIRLAFLALSTGLFSFDCWCTWKTSRTVALLQRQQTPRYSDRRSNTPDLEAQRTPKNGSGSTLRPRLFSHHSGSNSGRRLSNRKEENKSQRTMIATVFGCASFSTAALCAIASNIVTLSHVGLNHTTPEHRMDQRVVNAGRPFRYASAVFQLGGYILLVVIVFERCRLIFSESVFALPPGVVRFVRYVIATMTLLISVATVLTPFVNPIITISLIFTPMIAYPSISLWTGYRFMSTSIEIAKTVQCSEKSNTLLNGSLRLSVVIWVAVISTVMMSVSFVAYAWKENYVTNVIFYLLWYTDGAINCLCLVLTFSLNWPIYERVFGCMHHRWLSWMIDRYSIKSVMHPVSNESDT